MRKFLPKAAIAILVLAGLSWLFLKTVEETNAEPYVIDPAELTGWTLAVENSELGGPAFLSLQPPVPLMADVFRQIFQRSGVSLAGPNRASMPVVLASEFDQALTSVLSADELLRLARSAGLETERFQPVCMGITRVSTGGPVVQRFFMVFESKAFRDFRQELARAHQSRGGAGNFDPAALRPIVPVASFAPDFDQWPWPLQFDQATDCATRLQG
jgi:hypothetical protein